MDLSSTIDSISQSESCSNQFFYELNSSYGSFTSSDLINGSDKRIGERCSEDGTDTNYPVFVRVLLVTGFIVIVIIGSTANLAVLILSLRPSRSPTVSTLNKYILNLSITDLLYITGSVFYTITNYTGNGWIFGDIGCRLILTMDFLTMHVSVYILGVMSVERYIAVVHPMRSLRQRSPVCVRRLIFAIWTLSMTLVVPCFIGMKKIDHHLEDDQIISSCRWTLGGESGMRIYMSTMFFTAFLLPSVAMFLVYGLLLNHFLRAVTPIRKTGLADVRRSKKRVAKIIFLIVIIYWICYLPFWTWQMHILHVVADGQQANPFWGLLVVVLSYLNSCLNPFLYTLLSCKFRKVFQKCCSFCNDG